jgi:hypothetical protein
VLGKSKVELLRGGNHTGWKNWGVTFVCCVLLFPHPEFYWVDNNKNNNKQRTKSGVCVLCYRRATFSLSWAVVESFFLVGIVVNAL